MHRSRLLTVVIALCVFTRPTSVLPAPTPPSSQDANGQWLVAPRSFPKERYGSASTYDPVRKRMWMFGGRSSSVSLSDLWFRSLAGPATWTQVDTEGPGPVPMAGASLVYDLAQDRLILFGGETARQDSLWALVNLDGEPTWSQLITTGTPPGQGLLGPASIYDPVRNRILEFGGGAPLPAYNDVWSLDLTTPTPAWSLLTTVGGPPSPREFMPAIYDSAADRMVVFGGMTTTSAFTPSAETWTLSLAGTPTWTAQSPAGPLPTARAWHAASYDPVHERMIVVGGNDLDNDFGDVWSLDLTGTMAWTPGLDGVTAIPPREQQAQVFDADSNRVVLFGGQGANTDLGDDIAFGVAGLVRTPGLPYPRFGQRGSYDPIHHDMIVFGGGYGGGSPGQSNSTLALHLDPHVSWREITPVGPLPPGRLNHVQAFDPTGQRLIIYGGGIDYPDFQPPLGDVWQLDLGDPPSWTPLSPGGAIQPGARDFCTAAFDPVRRRLMVFGGRDASGQLPQDFWALSLGGSVAWNLINLGNGPVGRYGASMVYDSRRDRMIMFGGALSGSSFLGDLEAYDLDSTGVSGWNTLSAIGAPPSARYVHEAMYDSVRDRMVLFGGFDGAWRSDVWELALGGASPTWTQLTPAGPLPTMHLALGSIYDPVFDRMVAYGALSPGSAEDTWELAWTGIPTPALASLVDENTGSGTAHLTWFTPDGAGVNATVERTSQGDPWSSVASIVSNGSGLLSYEDHVGTGGRYGYRLAIGAEQTLTEVTWVDVPAPGGGLALARVRPNPSRGGPVLEFRLGSGATAEVTVFDVRGRRVFAKDVTALGPGAHMLDLRGELVSRAGVYLAVLRQGGRSSTRKFALLP